MCLAEGKWICCVECCDVASANQTVSFFAAPKARSGSRYGLGLQDVFGASSVRIITCAVAMRSKRLFFPSVYVLLAMFVLELVLRFSISLSVFSRPLTALVTGLVAANGAEQ